MRRKNARRYTSYLTRICARKLPFFLMHVLGVTMWGIRMHKCENERYFRRIRECVIVWLSGQEPTTIGLCYLLHMDGSD